MNDAFQSAVETVSPTAPPEVIAQSLRSIATKYALTERQTVNFVRKYFTHFQIDIFGQPTMFRLRSGYQIPIEDDFSRVVNHLKNAIIGESVTRFAAGSTGDFTNLWKEIEEEVQHVAFKTHETAIRMLVGFMLLEESRAHWGKLVNDAFPFLEIDSLPPSDIPNFLKTSRRKAVLILGKDTGEGLKRLEKIKNVVEKKGYQCILIKELPEHGEMGLIGKVLFTALAARFVIIENSTPSGHLYELPFVRMAECVIALLQEEGTGATWMTEDMVSKHPLLKKFTYTDDTCESAIADAIAWAETRIAENIKANTGAWPWAQDTPSV